MMVRYTYNQQMTPPAPFVHVSLRPPCVGLMLLLMGWTGPSSDIVSGVTPDGNTPNHPGGGADAFRSRHPGGCDFLVCDGSVRFMKQTLTSLVFRALASRPGGEVIGADQY